MTNLRSGGQVILLLLGWMFSLASLASVTQPCAELAADPFDPQNETGFGVFDYDVDVAAALPACFEAARHAQASPQDLYHYARVRYLMGDDYAAFGPASKAAEAGYTAAGVLRYRIIFSKLSPNERNQSVSKLYDAGYTQIAYYDGLLHYKKYLESRAEGLNLEPFLRQSAGAIWRAAIPQDGGPTPNPHALFLFAYFDYVFGIANTSDDTKQHNLQAAAAHGVQIAKAFVAGRAALDTGQQVYYDAFFYHLRQSLLQNSLVAPLILEFMTRVQAGDYIVEGNQILRRDGTAFNSNLLYLIAARAANSREFKETEVYRDERVLLSFHLNRLGGALDPTKGLIDHYKTSWNDDKLERYLTNQSAIGNTLAQDELLEHILGRDPTADNLREALQFFHQVYKKTGQLNVGMAVTELLLELGEFEQGAENLRYVASNVDTVSRAKEVVELAYAYQQDALAEELVPSFVDNYGDSFREWLANEYVKKALDESYTLEERSAWAEKTERAAYQLERMPRRLESKMKDAREQIRDAKDDAVALADLREWYAEYRENVIEKQEALWRQLRACGHVTEEMRMAPRSASDLNRMNDKQRKLRECWDGLVDPLKRLRDDEFRSKTVVLPSGAIESGPAFYGPKKADEMMNEIWARREKLYVTIDEANKAAAQHNDRVERARIEQEDRRSRYERSRERYRQADRTARHNEVMRKFRDICRSLDSAISPNYKPITVDGC